MKPQLKPEINFGHILTAIMMIAGMAVGWGAHTKSMNYLEKKDSEHDAEIKSHAHSIHGLEKAQERILTSVEFIVSEIKKNTN